MKKSLSLIILNLLVSVPLFSQWVYMDSVGNNIRALSSSLNYLYACTSLDGIFYSVDSGFSWHASNNGITDMNVRTIAGKDSLLFAGTQTGLFKSLDLGMTWIHAYGIPSSDIREVKFRGDSILIGSFGSGIYISVDDGFSFSLVNNGLSDHYINCLFVHGSRIFAGTDQGGGIFASDDNGATWVQKNNGVPVNPWAPSKYDMILCFANNGSTLFASTWDCGILISEDNGESWGQIQVGNNTVWNYINSITCYNGGLLAGCYGTGIYKSIDNGMTWVEINEGLPDWSVQSIHIYGNYLYAGTTNAHVFRRPLSEIITSIQEDGNMEETNVYPDPVTGISKILIPDYQQEQYSLTIYSVNGNLIKGNEHPSGNFFTISKSDFNKGCYFFSLKKNGIRVSSGKFIVN